MPQITSEPTDRAIVRDREGKGNLPPFFWIKSEEVVELGEVERYSLVSRWQSVQQRNVPVPQMWQRTNQEEIVWHPPHGMLLWT